MIFRSGFPVAAALLMTCCARRAETYPQAPVVLISVDTLRADHLPVYGYRRLETPAIDRLRRDAVLFENAYSNVPLTLPSHATVLTGLLPYQHGVRDNIGFRLARGRPTLAFWLREKGYATGGAVSSYLLEKSRGLDQGFDFYDDEFGDGAREERPGDATAERLRKWLDAAGSKPVFLFLHLYEPHSPYVPPEPYRSRHRLNPYDGEIAAADAVVGRFLDDLRHRGLYDGAIILFFSDHGEGLGDHGEEEHGVFLYREAIRVPLLLKLPGSRSAGAVVRQPVGLEDVFPTVMALVGLPTPEGLPGRPLPVAEGTGEHPTRRIYSETLYPRLHMHWSDLTSLTDARYQYIEAPRPELYDLLTDPAERNNLAGGMPPPFRSMRLEVQRLVRPLQSPEASTPEEIAKLASLGYIGVMAGTLTDRNLPDPKDHVAELPRYKRLFTLFYAKNDAEAVAAARDLLVVNPRFLPAWRMLSESLDRLGKPGEAASVLEKGIAEVGETGIGEEISQAYEQLAALLEKSGDRPRLENVLRAAMARNLATEPVRRGLARLLTETGRANEAVAVLSPLKDVGDPDTLDRLGIALAESGKLEEAEAAFQRALLASPRNASVLLHLGSLALRRKDPTAAREWFEKSLRAEPDAPGTLTLLGVARIALSDEAGAREAWQRALALDLGQYDALFNLAILDGRRGRTEEARRALERFVAKAPADRYAANLAEARRLLRLLPKR
ncbi:MAG TPA: sulfatase-like hydrolase/transferase [Thermoanaerobaculia bacterium]